MAEFAREQGVMMKKLGRMMTFMYLLRLLLHNIRLRIIHLTLYQVALSQKNVFSDGMIGCSSSTQTIKYKDSSIRRNSHAGYNVSHS